MIVRNSQSYRLLTVVAMSGECSKEAMELLMPQDSYRKKLMMQLTGDNLIKGYEKNAVKGYRLSRRGKDHGTRLEEYVFVKHLEK